MTLRFLNEDIADQSGSDTQGLDGELRGISHVKSAIEIISLFPPDYFQQNFSLNEILIVKTLGNMAGGFIDTGGDASESLGRIRFASSNSGGPDLVSVSEIVAHELFHVYRRDHIDKDSSLKDIPKSIASSLLGIPYAPSLYAVWGGEDEYHAETGRKLLIDGVPNPNTPLNYSSESSTQQLNLLIGIEKDLPGFASYLAAHVNSDSTLQDKLSVNNMLDYDGARVVFAMLGIGMIRKNRPKKAQKV